MAGTKAEFLSAPNTMVFGGFLPKQKVTCAPQAHKKALVVGSDSDD